LFTEKTQGKSAEKSDGQGKTGFSLTSKHRFKRPLENRPLWHLGYIILQRGQVLVAGLREGAERATRPAPGSDGGRKVEESLMKRMLFAGAIAVAAASPALAADLPPAAPPPQAPAYVPAPVPVFTWSGIYIGVNGGYGFGNTDWQAAPGFADTGNFNIDGGLVGGTLGFNFQSGAFVFGIEGDGDWADINGSSTCTGGTCQTQSDWLATLRGRVGYAFDRVLIYATGGGAAGDVKGTYTPTGGAAGSTDNTEFGWTAGAGVEFALTENVTAKVEYLFVDLANGSGTCTGAPCAAGGTTVPVTFDTSLVRGGINFKFNPF
jgi:outer membrane immunogenic protein